MEGAGLRLRVEHRRVGLREVRVSKHKTLLEM